MEEKELLLRCFTHFKKKGNSNSSLIDIFGRSYSQKDLNDFAVLLENTGMINKAPTQGKQIGLMFTLTTEIYARLLNHSPEILIEALNDERIKNDQTGQLQFEELELKVDALRRDFFDYEQVKRDSRISLRISVLAVVITVILGILQIVCNKN